MAALNRPARDLGNLAHQFAIDGDFVAVEPYGTGHINDTYCATFRQAGTPVRYILQRVNRNVFKNPGALMENVRRVTTHIAAKLANEADVSRRVLTLVPTRAGQCWLETPGGECWRIYLFLENAKTYDAIQSTDQAFQAARAFGQFQTLLADLPAPPLHATIPDFHHTPRRVARFEAVVAADARNRARLARPEIEFALRCKPFTGVLVESGLPERVTHNDCKLNNVMLDDRTGEGICAIDLDTVMPGLVLYDFGDMVRTSTCPAKEDERDLSRIEMRFPFFEALVRGYLSATTEFLTRGEREQLAFAGKLITFEIGLRFLTDFLEGDVYFKIHREGHNLDRCRTQFKLVECIEQQEERMRKLVESTHPEPPAGGSG